MQLSCGDAWCGRAAPDIVLAADTVVALDGAILNKPVDDAEARAMLAALRGRPHRVLTGMAVAVDGTIAWDCVGQTTVWMRDYSPDEVERYIASGKQRDKAGAYGIQDLDFRPVDRIDGCLSNVVGLPLCEVRRALAAIDSARRWTSGWQPPVASFGCDFGLCCDALAPDV